MKPTDIHERTVIAAVLHAPESAIPTLLGKVAANDFRQPACAEVFATALTMFHDQRPIDPALIATELDSRSRLHSITLDHHGVELMGQDAIDQLATGIAPNVSTVTAHADRVRQAAQLRRVGAALERAQQASASGKFAPVDVLSELQDYVAVEMGRNSDDAIGMAEAVRRLGSEYAAQDARPDALVKTGIEFIDKSSRIGGFTPGQLVIIGARPGVGKTSLASTLAANVGTNKSGTRALVIQAEQAGWEQTERLASIITGKGVRDLWETQRALWTSLAETCDLARVRIVMDGPAPTLAAIAGHAHRQHAKDGLALLIIDQLSKIAREPHEERMTEREWFGKCSWTLKRLAMDLGIVVCLLHQCNRTSRQAKRPAMHHLEGSGKLEQDADAIILLDRDLEHDEQTDAQGEAVGDRLRDDEAWCNVAKRRGGTPRAGRVKFDASTGRFSDDTAGPTYQPRDRTAPAYSHENDVRWQEERDDEPF